jgi:hypothetical protein
MARTASKPAKALRSSHWDRERLSQFFGLVRVFLVGSALFLVAAMVVI